ncbi:MAG: hypothetical protein U1E23_05485 [Reyranellaceae bacterium]
MAFKRAASNRRPVTHLDPVAPDSGGGQDGGISNLESRVGALEAKVDALRVDVAELKGKVSQLPTVWTVVMANFGLAITVAALASTIARATR